LKLCHFNVNTYNLAASGIFLMKEKHFLLN
jgi:hypothetical protein